MKFPSASYAAGSSRTDPLLQAANASEVTVDVPRKLSGQIPSTMTADSPLDCWVTVAEIQFCHCRLSDMFNRDGKAAISVATADRFTVDCLTCLTVMEKQPSATADCLTCLTVMEKQPSVLPLQTF